MSPDEPHFITVGNPESERKIAVRYRAPTHKRGPGLVWLGGYRSDMLGTKAEAMDAWAVENGLACCRHDYSGHGESGGDFATGTISSWLEDSLAVFKKFTSGPQLIVGSSMGAWIALRMAQELANEGAVERLHGMVLLAPAPDFTHELMLPKLTEKEHASLNQRGFFEEFSEYSDEPNMFTKALIDDGENNRVMIGTVKTQCPVHVIQGMEDPDVPWQHAAKLMELMAGDDVTMTLVRDGDHRLSRDQDIKRFLAALTTMASLTNA